jgi:hypothetical protein
MKDLTPIGLAVTVIYVKIEFLFIPVGRKIYWHRRNSVTPLHLTGIIHSQETNSPLRSDS